jgi:hypothetical protein
MYTNFNAGNECLLSHFHKSDAQQTKLSRPVLGVHKLINTKIRVADRSQLYENCSLLHLQFNCCSVLQPFCPEPE